MTKPVTSDEEYQRRTNLLEEHEERERRDFKRWLIRKATPGVGSIVEGVQEVVDGLRDAKDD
jgi:hypothetical protein